VLLEKMTKYLLFIETLFVLKYCLIASKGHKDVTGVLLGAGASLFTVDKQVINPLVKLRQSNVKPFK
jgi:hypothetical protein